MSAWIPPSPVTSRREPYLVARADLGALREDLAEHGAGVSELDVSGVESMREILVRLKAVLPFPHWMGAGWDSVWDVTEELCAELRFPHALIVRHYDELLIARQHAALELAIRISGFAWELSRRKSQLLVYYEGEVWT